MKKVIALLMAMVMGVLFVGCSRRSESVDVVVENIRTFIKEYGDNDYMVQCPNGSGTLSIIEKSSEDGFIEGIILLKGLFFDFTTPLQSISIEIYKGQELVDFVIRDENWNEASGTINPKTYEFYVERNSGISERLLSENAMENLIQSMLLDFDEIFNNNGLPYTHIDLGFERIN